jgi:cytochrome c biogenesis protein CcdA
LWRVAASGISVVVAAVIGVVTALVTTRSSWGLWVALGALVLLGAVLQATVTRGERRSSSKVSASGAGAVAVGGSAGEIRTRVRGKTGDAEPSQADGVAASGSGAVALGGDSTGPISTDVAGSEE